eukprot:5092168-Prymnesium_polylepis.1
MVPAASESNVHSRTSAIEHNRRIKAAVAENARRATVYKDYEKRSAQALATALDTALRPKAGSLLSRLKRKFRDDADSQKMGCDVYDGHAMVLEMRALRANSSAAPAKVRSHEFHEGQYAVMKATKLPDGCSSQEYADKCNQL